MPEDPAIQRLKDFDLIDLISKTAREGARIQGSLALINVELAARKAAMRIQALENANAKGLGSFAFLALAEAFDIFAEELRAIREHFDEMYTDAIEVKNGQ